MPQFSLCIKETLHQADFRRLRPCFELLMSVVLEVTVKNLILITHFFNISCRAFCFQFAFFFFFKQTHIWFFLQKKKMLFLSFFFLLPKHSSKRFVFVFEQSTVWISIWQSVRREVVNQPDQILMKILENDKFILKPRLGLED